MKIEVGKYYKTRDGRRAFVAGHTLDNPFVKHAAKWRFIGYLSGEPDQYVWGEGGEDFCDGNERPLDLVSEWREPRTEAATIYLNTNCYKNGVEASFTPARDNYQTLARKRVTITEGEFE